MKTFKKSMLIVLIVMTFFVVASIGIFFMSYKTLYLSVVKTFAIQNNVDVPLVMAIIKAESKFDANAKSKANAIGLMQIKLETANYMLSLSGQAEITESELFDPQTNIELGTRYIKYLLDKFENVQVCICAYNAGETVVSAWLKDENYSSDGKTLKKIPFAETNTYLKKVMQNYRVYKNFLKVWFILIIIMLVYLTFFLFVVNLSFEDVLHLLNAKSKLKN